MKSMKINLVLLMLVSLAMNGCQKQLSDEGGRTLSDVGLNAKSGAVQISGPSVFAQIGECDYPSLGANYAVKMTGDLEGCFYSFVDEYECSPSGTYREKGRDYFVGTYDGEAGSFWTTYKFEAKFEGCADGAPLGAEILGRCQHPITAGSGEGVFEGVTGRVDIKDDVEAQIFYYRGHLKF